MCPWTYPFDPESIRIQSVDGKALARRAKGKTGRRAEVRELRKAVTAGSEGRVSAGEGGLS